MPTQTVVVATRAASRISSRCPGVSAVAYHLHSDAAGTPSEEVVAPLAGTLTVAEAAMLGVAAALREVDPSRPTVLVVGAKSAHAALTDAAWTPGPNTLLATLEARAEMLEAARAFTDLSVALAGTRDAEMAALQRLAQAEAEAWAAERMAAIGCPVAAERLSDAA